MPQTVKGGLLLVSSYLIRRCLTKKYWSFEGRASRLEFWGFALFGIAVHLALTVVTGTWQSKPLLGHLFAPSHEFHLLRMAGTAVELVVIVPAIALTFRRFQDTGLSGWWYPGIALAAATIGILLQEVGLLATIFSATMLAVLLRKGQRDANRYGPPPDDSAPEPDQEAWPLGLEAQKPWGGRVNRRPLGLALLALAILGFVDLTLWGSSSDAPEPFFDPDQKQVVLLDPGDDGLWGNYDDSLWAFSFPQEMTVHPAVEYRNVTVLTPEIIEDLHRKGTAALQTELQPEQLKNEESTLKILLSLPDFDNLAGSFADRPQAALDISLPSRKRLHGGTPDWGTVPSFIDEFEKLTKFDCEIDREIAPGIIRLREMSREAELAAIQELRHRGPRFEIHDGCMNKAAARGARYAVMNEAGEPAGFGTCEAFRESARFGSCHFEFWLPQERMVSYRFSEEFLPMLREIDHFARDLLMQATAAHVSKNIALPDSNG